MTQNTDPAFLPADWPAPSNIRAVVTTRCGGTSEGDWDSFNLAQHVSDDAQHVNANRQRLSRILNLPAEPLWLNQVHGVQVVDAAQAEQNITADGSYATTVNTVCCVMTADCLPVLLTDDEGSFIAALHAGWRGLLDGVIEAAVDQYPADKVSLMAWLGPAIGPAAFEVGDEVRDAFCQLDPPAAQAFVAGRDGKWLADLYALARMRLQKKGVTRIYGGDFCTFSQPEQFYSFRRDGQTGRMASLIWRVS